MNDDKRLLELALRISDGLPVEWEELLEQSQGSRESELLDQLRTLEAMAEFHRRQPYRQEKAGGGSADSSRPGEGTQRWGQLEIRELIGSGAFGEVYRAWDPQLRREVALKLLWREISTGQQREAALREGRILAQIKHPNVATVHGAAEDQGRVGLWMELVPGQTLSDLISDRGVFGPREAVGIGIDICRAVSAVHHRGLLHRDIKSQNIMREEGGRIVLMDFGLGEEPLGRLEPPASSLKGTPLFMAPELFRNRPASVQSDIYAIGVVVYQLVTATFPVSATSLKELKEKHTRRRQELLRDSRPGLPAGFVKVVETALDPDPGRRFETAGELEHALEKCMATPDVSLPESRLPRPVGLVRWFVVLMLLFLGTLGFYLWQSGGAPAGEQPVSIAITRFQNLTEDSELDWLSRGVADELVHNLSQSENLQVLSLERVNRTLERAQTRSQDWMDALSSQDARYAVTGSIVGQGEQLEVLAQIHDLEGGHVIQAKRVEGLTNESIFPLLGRLAAEIRLALEIEADEEPEVRSQLARAKTLDYEAFKAYQQGREMLDQKRFQAAVVRLLEAVERDPEYVVAWDLLANAYDNLGERDSVRWAVDNAKQILRRKNVPRVDQFRILLRDAQARMDWQAYGRYVRELTLLQPGEPEWFFRHGWYLTAHPRDYTRAIEKFRRAVRLGAEPRYYSYLGFAHLSVGQRQEAVQAYQTYVAERPQEASAHDDLGYAYLVTGHYQDARAELETALKLQPDFLQAMAHLGQLDLAEGRVLAAQERFDSFFDAALGGNQERDGHFFQAWFFLQTRKLREAARAIRASLAADPLSVRSHWLQGLIFLENGQQLQARDCIGEMDRILEEQRTLRHKEYRHHLQGKLLLAGGRPVEATSEFELAVALGPADRAPFLQGLAEAHAQAGQTAQAQEVLKQSLAFNPAYAPGLILLGGLLEERRDFSGALSSYQKAVEVYRQADSDFEGLQTARQRLDHLSKTGPGSFEGGK